MYMNFGLYHVVQLPVYRKRAKKSKLCKIRPTNGSSNHFLGCNCKPYLLPRKMRLCRHCSVPVLQTWWEQYCHLHMCMYMYFHPLYAQHGKAAISHTPRFSLYTPVIASCGRIRVPLISRIFKSARGLRPCRHLRYGIAMVIFSGTCIMVHPSALK